PLSCPICGWIRFSLSQALLSTKGANFFGFDWTNPNADTYTCMNCGYILWFLPTDEEEMEEEFEKAEQTLACTFCGHTGFWTRETLLSTRGATFFHLDWTNPNADNYICTHCAQVLWFAQTEDDEEGDVFERAGHVLRCPICQQTHFWTQE